MMRHRRWMCGGLLLTAIDPPALMSGNYRLPPLWLPPLWSLSLWRPSLWLPSLWIGLGLVLLLLLFHSSAEAGSRVRQSFEAELALEVDSNSAVTPDGIPNGYHQELLALGYRPAEWLRSVQAAQIRTLLYVRDELPVYARVTLRVDRDGDSAQLDCLQLDTFFAERGRVSTTTSGALARATAACTGKEARLAQLREGGTPSALDGQHLGTIRAWIAGGRTPLPIDPSHFLDQLRADIEGQHGRPPGSGVLPFTSTSRRSRILRF